MLILVTGGSGSGKSEFAEQLCGRLCPGKKYYIATMQVCDAESRERVGRHRRQRAGKGFETIECPVALEQLEVPSGSTVLLECLSNLVANEMYGSAGRLAGFAGTRSAGPEGRERADCFETPGKFSCKEEVGLLMRGIGSLQDRAEHLVIVTDQVFSDGIGYAPSTAAYMQLLAALGSGIAAMADEVYEVVHGIPLALKGSGGQGCPETILGSV